MEQVTPLIQNIQPITGRFIADDETVHNIINPASGAVKAIQREYFTVLNAASWTYSMAYAIGAGQSVKLLGKTNGTSIHFDAFSITSDAAPVTITLYEFPTVTAEGTPASGKNRNRESDVDATFELFTAPTVSANGEQLFIRNILGTHTTVGSDSFSDIWILKKNSYYLLTISNGSNQTANLITGFNWIEC